MLDFSNTEIAFTAKSDGKLRKAKVLFQIMKSPFLVKTGKFLSNIAIAIHFPIGWIVKPTIYQHFVGGETLEGCDNCVAELLSGNVESTLDYSAEGAEGEFFINRTFEETMRSIENAGRTKGIAYAVFKPTAITRVAVLEKVSSKAELNEEDQKEFEAFCSRMDALAAKAHELGVRLLVDAEHYCTQDAVDQVTLDLILKYNKERAIVFNTLQMYRWDRYDYLLEDHKRAKDNGCVYGCKFVRGAYMEEERLRAKKMGYADPICVDKQATDDNFDKGVAYVAENIDTMEMFCGTHNELSNQKLAEKIDSLGLERNDHRIYFAQLLGMSDNISYSLAAAGYRITKYVPYGPVREVLPYLIRRAEENTSVGGQTLRELSMLKSEVKRRKQAKKSK